MPLLVPGQRLTQAEFHRRYAAYPEDVRFELIGGTVYMSSPLRWRHGTYDNRLGALLQRYTDETPGTEVGHNATTILGTASEPQPDLAMRLLAEFGGRSRINTAGYLEGPPEWIGEIAISSLEIDLGAKREDYERAGVIEYLVVCLAEEELHWFHFPSGKPIKPDRQGIHRSRVFPGLWIEGPALLAGASKQLTKVLRAGLASPAHARFVKRLQTAHRKRSG
jgi:Uma2 family endonuclease